MEYSDCIVIANVAMLCMWTTEKTENKAILAGFGLLWLVFGTLIKVGWIS